MVDPPVLSRAFKVRGGEYHHHGRNSLIVISEYLKICEAVPEESVDVVVLPFKGSRGLHEERLDPCKGQDCIFVPWSDRPLVWRVIMGRTGD